jgi:hypothetical protein
LCPFPLFARGWLTRRNPQSYDGGQCRVPAHEKLCREAVWFMQRMLLGPRSDMDQIAEAIRRIRAHAGALAKA